MPSVDKCYTSSWLTLARSRSCDLESPMGVRPDKMVVATPLLTRQGAVTRFAEKVLQVYVFKKPCLVRVSILHPCWPCPCSHPCTVCHCIRHQTTCPHYISLPIWALLGWTLFNITSTTLWGKCLSVVVKCWEHSLHMTSSFSEERQL